MRAPPSLVLVTGLPGTGKSTVAAVVAEVLGTSVFAHDWVMSGLRPYRQIQDALDAITFGHRIVGWSILEAVARAQLIEGRHAVLDGVARRAQVEQCRTVAADTGARFVLITTECSDRAVHRARIEGRKRLIPDWYELRWKDVERSMGSWDGVVGELSLDAMNPWPQNDAVLRAFLGRL